MLYERYRRRIAQREVHGLARRPLRIQAREGKYIYVENRKLLNFASNDYLGLTADEELKQKIAGNFLKYGTSSSSSRLVSGNFDLLCQAEEVFANYFGYESALFFPSGYQANLAVISTFFEKGDTLLMDKHVHASIVKGVALSGANFKSFRHNSLSHLRKRIEEIEGKKVTGILTESLFSIDGDILDVDGLAHLKVEFNLFCVVDEAHSFGVLGEGGKGIARKVADIAIGTFGKAFGFFGAFVLLPQELKEYLFNFSSPLIYSTALPAAHAASAMDILEVVKKEEKKRELLRETSRKLKEELLSRHLPVRGDAHILSLLIGDEKKALAWANKFLASGIFVFAVRYPTVPKGQAMIRFSLSALHEKEDIEFLLACLDQILGESGR